VDEAKKGKRGVDQWVRATHAAENRSKLKVSFYCSIVEVTENVETLTRLFPPFVALSLCCLIQL